MSRRNASTVFEKGLKAEGIIDFLCDSMTGRIGEGGNERPYECAAMAEWEWEVRKGRMNVTVKQCASIENLVGNRCLYVIIST